MTTFEIIEVPSTTVAAVRRTVPVTEISDFFGAAFGQVAKAVAAAQGEITGPPFGSFHGKAMDLVDVSAGFPVGGGVDSPDPQVQVLERRGGPAAVGLHVGPYDLLERTYGELRAWLVDQGLHAGEEMWEEYLSPPEGDPATWQTRVVVPLT